MGGLSIWRWLVLVIGLPLGIIYLKLAAKAIFVLPNEGLLLNWMFLLAGPLSVLPATVVGFFRPTAGAVWFLSGGLVSSAAVVGMELHKGVPSVTGLFLACSAPMLVLGVFAFLGRKK